MRFGAKHGSGDSGSTGFKSNVAANRQDGGNEIRDFARTGNAQGTTRMSRQVKSSTRSLFVGGLWCAACSFMTLCLAAPLAAQEDQGGFAVKVQGAHERI